MTSDEDEEESKTEEIRQITPANKILPANNNQYSSEMSIDRKNKKSPSTPALRSPSCRTTQQYTTWRIINQ